MNRGYQAGAVAVDRAVPPQEDDGAGRGERLFALGLLLVVIVAITLLAVTFEIVAIYRLGTILLADILLMFLYLEVIGMVALYYAKRNSVFVYPILLRSLRSDGWSS
ncbi:hypothetical protein [Ruegeria marina]|uniref:Protein PsiE n=1 Tax=Ruegeria marina TaxID=639004 RepID=A0A1G6YH52_9RHOB|nr:hypothetical protein [Ruegeria marina]SDD89698.1 protein PsiE [Ruegeria marina]